MPNPWPNCANIPTGPAAALAALHLDDLVFQPLTEATLDYCDACGLTLPLRAVLPGHNQRLDESHRKNLVRLRNIREAYRKIGEWLTAAGIDSVALKGLTHCELFGSVPEERVQYDIDLWIPGAGSWGPGVGGRGSGLTGKIHAAQAVLIEHGYEPLKGMERFPTDHLPALVPKTGWKWRGDFFDPEIPLSIELHFRLWNEDLERLRAPGVEEFWSRRNGHLLHPADALAYAALHLLRHLLRGSVKPFHVYEIARILDAFSANDTFWSEWRSLHSPELRRLQAIVFRLSREWFGGRIASIPEQEIEQLPAGAQTWFQEFAMSPATAQFHPNKDELWLHLSLLESRRDRFNIAFRRLVPRNLPPRADAGYFATRLRHHAVSLLRAVRTGARWWWLTNSLGSQFWAFLISAVL